MSLTWQAQAQGPGQKPGASSYTWTRLSLSGGGQGESLVSPYTRGSVSLLRRGEQHPPPRDPTLRPLASMRLTNRCVICIADVALHSWFVVIQGLPDVARLVILSTCLLKPRWLSSLASYDAFLAPCGTLWGVLGVH